MCDVTISSNRMQIECSFGMFANKWEILWHLLVSRSSKAMPCPRFNIADFYKNVSEFSRIFDSKYFRMSTLLYLMINKMQCELHPEFGKKT